MSELDTRALAAERLAGGRLAEATGDAAEVRAEAEALSEQARHAAAEAETAAEYARAAARVLTEADPRARRRPTKPSSRSCSPGPTGSKGRWQSTSSGTRHRCVSVPRLRLRARRSLERSCGDSALQRFSCAAARARPGSGSARSTSRWRGSRPSATKPAAVWKLRPPNRPRATTVTSSPSVSTAASAGARRSAR